MRVESIRTGRAEFVVFSPLYSERNGEKARGDLASEVNVYMKARPLAMAERKTFHEPDERAVSGPSGPWDFAGSDARKGGWNHTPKQPDDRAGS